MRTTQTAAAVFAAGAPPGWLSVGERLAGGQQGAVPMDHRSADWQAPSSFPAGLAHGLAAGFEDAADLLTLAPDRYNPE